MQTVVASVLLMMVVNPASGAPAQGDGAATAATQAGDFAKPAKPEKICREVEPTTGSRLVGTRRVCRTAEQWAKVDRNSGASGSGMMVHKEAGDN